MRFFDDFVGLRLSNAEKETANFAAQNSHAFMFSGDNFFPEFLEHVRYAVKGADNAILIAGINYVNLSTAKASVRAKEVGVRKVAGAFRSSLVNQFLIESVITCLIAAALAIVIAQLLLPVVNSLTLKHLTVAGNPSVLVYMIMAALFLGVVAGFFPAVYLSSFRPILVLKGLKFSDK